MTRKYLQRIGIQKVPSLSIEGLSQLHLNHVMNIPFENLDIQRNIPILLNLDHIKNKVIANKRGGFCYELNYLFCNLLLNLGFNAHIISARIFDDANVLGPDFDHMAVIVEIEDSVYLVDVGFGDLFLSPLNIHQTRRKPDSNSFYSIDQLNDHNYLLSQSKDGISFDQKYIFDNKQCHFLDFEKQCKWKQSSKDSYFVKNKICTQATPTGRVTLFNDALSIADTDQKKKIPIRDSKQEAAMLKEHFGICL